MKKLFIKFIVIKNLLKRNPIHGEVSTSYNKYFLTILVYEKRALKRYYPNVLYFKYYYNIKLPLGI